MKTSQTKKSSKAVPRGTNNVRRLTEVSILLALATVLSLFKLYQLPYGGAFTLASMFPLILIAYRHGVGVGFFAGVIYGVMQQLFSLSYIQGMTLFSAMMVIILDYGLAFAVVGISGVFRKSRKGQSFALICGTLLGCFLRYLCHTIAGCTVWAGVSVPTGAAFVYSLLYNAAYMIPETLITLAAAYYIGSCIDFDRELPERIKSISGKEAVTSFDIAARLGVMVAAIVDIVIIFSHTQNDNGEFDITLITNITTTEAVVMAVVTAAAVMVFVVFKILKIKRLKTKE